MSFKDMIKNSVLDKVQSSAISADLIIATMLITCILALYIYAIYYLSQKNSFYNKSFNVSLAVIAILTAGIILAMQSSLVISLGMVGALSIVRFRTAIKDPKDLIFLFWAISIGIISGASMYAIAIIVSLIVTIMLFVLEMVPSGVASILLVVNMNAEGTEDEIIEVTKKFAKTYKVRSRNITADGIDMIVECKTKQEAELAKEVAAIKSVYSASVVSHDGEAVY